MLVATEGFDNLHPSYYYSLPCFACCNGLPFSKLTGPNLSPLGSAKLPFFGDPFAHDLYHVPVLQNHYLSSGYCLVLGDGGFVRPFSFEKSKKVTVGFNFAFQNFPYHWTDNIYNAHSPFSGGSDLGRLNMNRLNFFDVLFVNDPRDSTELRYAGYRPSDKSLFICRFYLFNANYFYVRFLTDETYNDTYTAYTDKYPIIGKSSLIPCDFSDSFTYFEVSVDTNNSINSGGSAEVRMNGKTVYKKENIITSAYLNYGSDPYSPLSYIYSVAFSNSFKYAYNYNTAVPNILLDDIYVTNESGGAYDSFLGPLKVSAQSSVSISRDEFEERDALLLDSDPEYSSYVRAFLELNPQKRLDSPSAGSADTFAVSFDNVDPSSEILGVSHRLGLIGPALNPIATNDGAVAPVIVSPSGEESVSSKDVPSAPGALVVRDVFYTYNPYTFKPFTVEDVSSMLFGFENTPSATLDVASVDILETRSGYSGNVANAFDSNINTYATCNQCWFYFDLSALPGVFAIEVFSSKVTYAEDVYVKNISRANTGLINPGLQTSDVAFGALTLRRNLYTFSCKDPVGVDIFFNRGSDYSNVYVYKVSIYRMVRT